MDRGQVAWTSHRRVITLNVIFCLNFFIAKFATVAKFANCSNYFPFSGKVQRVRLTLLIISTFLVTTLEHLRGSLVLLVTD